MRDKIKINVHPDTLMDAYYETAEICTSGFHGISFDKNTITETPNGVSVIGTDGRILCVEVCHGDMLRIRIVSDTEQLSVTESLELIKSNMGGKFTWSCTDDRLVFSTAALVFTYDFSKGDIKVTNTADELLLSTKYGGVLILEDEAEYSGTKSLTFFNLPYDEEIFGFGARNQPLRRTHKSIDIFTQKVGYKDGDYGGFPLPYFMSSKGYGLFFNNPWPHVYFDMGETRFDEWFVYSPGGDCDFFVFDGKSPADIVCKFTDIVGKPSLSRRWMHGLWMSSVNFVSGEEILGYARQMHDEGYPVDAFVMDGCWRGGHGFLDKYSRDNGYTSNDFEFHEEFGDGAEIIKQFKDMNMDLVLHINTRTFKTETAEYGIKNGLLRRQGEEVVPILTTPEGRDYYRTFLEKRIKDGVMQWWTDHGDRVSGEIASGIPSRCLFGALWNKFIAEVMADNGIDNHMCLSRGGGIGSQPYVLPWAGDTEVAQERFIEDICYSLSGGMSGFAYAAFDMGGFNRGKYRDGTLEDGLALEFEDNTICRRLCQAIVFSPIPRIHNGDILWPKLPWYFPVHTRKLLKDCLNLRYSLIPYIYSYAVNASQLGEPILRPLIYYHMDDCSVYSIDNEFYMGEFMLIAPVTERDVTKRTVYLPEGEWVNYHSKEVYSGKQYIEVDCPMYSMDGLPIFIKKGGAVVTQKPGLTISEGIPDVLTIDFYPDETAEIALKESESISNIFKLEACSKKAKLYLENNTEFVREYTVKINGSEKTAVKVSPKSIYQAEIEL